MLRVKIRDDLAVPSKAVYCVSVSHGTRDILGIWIEQNEGAKFRMKRNRWRLHCALYGGEGRRAVTALDTFERRSLQSRRSSRPGRGWTDVIPYLAFPPRVRPVIYTTNAPEGVKASVRKIIKTDERRWSAVWLARELSRRMMRGRVVVTGDESIGGSLRRAASGPDGVVCFARLT